MPSTIRGADSPHTTMRLRNGTSSASRRSPTRSRRATAPAAFTSIATLSPTTKSTSEPSAVRQKVSGRASRVYPSRALSSQKTRCSRARPNEERSARSCPSSLLPCAEYRNYSAGNCYLSAIELRIGETQHQISCSPGQTRTADMVVNSHPLYQLSYRGMRGHGVRRPRLTLITVFADAVNNWETRGGGVGKRQRAGAIDKEWRAR